MTLKDGQRSYRGLVWGPETDLVLVEEEGLEGNVAESSAMNLPRAHGASPGEVWTGAGSVLVRLRVGAGPQFEDELRSVLNAFGFSDAGFSIDELVFKNWDQPERMKRVTPLTIPVRRSTPNSVEIGVVLEASDPRVYSTVQEKVSLELYDPAGGGADYPGDYPKDLTAGGSNEVVVTNKGNANAYPTIKFFGTDGSIDAVRLLNRATNEELEVITTIGVGQQLTADMEAVVTAADRLKISLDGASRYGDWTLPREPLALAPGDNLLRYTIDGTSVDTVCTVTWRDTWMT